MTGEVVRLHMPRHLAAADGSGLPYFYRVLREGLTARGAVVEVRRRDGGPAGGPGFHFVHNGTARGERVLNTAIAYLNPFFYADPLGIYFESSLSTARFDASAVPVRPAARFFETLRERHVLPRKSRYAQPEPVEDFPEGAIAVFLQDWSEPVERARHMDAPAMVEAVIAGAGGRPVIVKPHPRNRGEETLLLLHELRGRAGVTVTQANLHDILARAAVSVSISSSVAMEGMLHRVPALLFGRSDLHHCAETVTEAAGFAPALHRALQRDWPFEAFLFWFLRQQNLRSGPEMIAPLLERMRAAGADLEALGIRD